MTNQRRTVVLYIAMSLDGYIARPDGDIGWLSTVEREGEDYGYEQFVQSVDTVIMGRKTYDKVLSFGIPFPHASKECYIITRTARPAQGRVSFYTGDLRTLVTELRSRSGKDIFVDGGAEVVRAMLRYHLIDEFIISVIPVILGEGIPLFSGGVPEIPVDCISVKHFESGLVQLHYRRKEQA